MPRLFRLVLLASLVSVSLPASAHPGRPVHPGHWRVVVGPPPPVVVVRLGPWRSDWRPAPRPGWVWIAGDYATNGAWVPGHWEPASVRPGYAWVAGHWVGEQWVEGYWREAERPGAEWVEGRYDVRGDWIPGYWRAYGPPPVAPGPPQPGIVVPVAPGLPPEAAPAPEAPPAPLVDPQSGDIRHDYE